MHVQFGMVISAFLGLKSYTDVNDLQLLYKKCLKTF